MTIHIIVSILLLLVFLLASVLYAKKKYQINLAILGLGAVAFFLSSQILENWCMFWFCILKKMVVLPSCKTIRFSISSMA